MGVGVSMWGGLAVLGGGEGWRGLIHAELGAPLILGGRRLHFTHSPCKQMG